MSKCLVYFPNVGAGVGSLYDGVAAGHASALPAAALRLAAARGARARGLPPAVARLGHAERVPDVALDGVIVEPVTRGHGLGVQIAGDL